MISVRKAVPIDTAAGRTWKKSPVLPYVFLAPMVLSLLVFTLISVLWSLGLSFTNDNLVNPTHFVGMGSYAYALLHSTMFGLAGRHSLWSGVAVPLSIVISLGAAFLINALPWRQGLFRFICYWPFRSFGYRRAPPKSRPYVPHRKERPRAQSGGRHSWCCR